MKFTLKQMRYAEAAGRHGSIAKAAAELNISQSSIAAAIDSIEQGLGVDLFLRQPAKGVAPTPAGRRALDIMRKTLTDAAQAEAELESLGGAAKGRLRLGAYVTVAPFVLPPVLKAFSERCPEARIDLFEGDLAQMTAGLAAGEIDLAITYVRSGDPELDVAPLTEARPYALVSADDLLATRRSVRLAELAARPFVMLDLHGARAYFMGLFESAGVRPRIAHSTRSSEIVRALVAGGFGVSILNIRSGREHLDGSGHRCLPLDDDVRAPTLGVAMMPGVRRLMLSRIFLEVCDGLRADGAFDALVVPAAPRLRGTG